MKKNLKIVSAAAAALLAVAPVAATAVSTVNAASISSFSGIGSLAVKNGTTVNVTPKISFNTRTPLGVPASIHGSVTAEIGGQSYTGNFKSDDETTLWGEDSTGSNTIYPGGTTKYKQITNLQDVTDIKAGKTYYVHVNSLDFNLGSSNANKEIELNFGDNGYFTSGSHTGVNKAKVTTDQNGVVHLTNVYLAAVAKDFANPAVVSWHDYATGHSVESGDITLYAGSDAGKLNVNEVVSEARNKYYAENSVRPQSSTITYSNNLSDALKAMGVTVDSDGFFTAPKHFSFKLTAKANNNDASNALTVNVNVPNGKDISNPSEYDHTVRVWNRKASYIYNANHQKQGFGIMYKIGSGHNVVAENGQPKVYHLDGFNAYKLADGHYKGNYVDVRNFSTTRQNRNVKVVTTRSRVFTNTGRVVGKHNYVNAGVRVRVRGTKTIKGHKMYRIATNRYIKAANVRNA